MKRDNTSLLHYDIITNPPSRTATHNDRNTHRMTDHTLLAKARKARFDDLPNFSGHASEDVERFLKSIKNITKANEESNSSEILEIVRGKLSQSAGLWFDNNESSFRRWSDFEIAFRNRYFSSTMVHQKFDKLKQRKQLPDETVVAYYDDVVTLCREIDPTMSEQMIIRHLISGLDPSFKKEMSRHESSLNTLSAFLKYAKIEQDLHDTFEINYHASGEQHKPYFAYNQALTPTLTAVVKEPQHSYQHAKQDGRHSQTPGMQSSVAERNSFSQTRNRPSGTQYASTRGDYQRRTYNSDHSDDLSSSRRTYNSCKVCGRRNHRTIDCFNKRASGCFNCGQNHAVRDCPMPPNFQ